MQEQSKYTVKSKDTFVSIAKQIGLKDPMKLKEYHNERADFNSQVGNQLHPNITLLMPSSEEVRELNAEKPFKDEVKQEQREEEQKQQEEKEKEAAAEQQKQEGKSEHDGQYYVVNGAKCICDKAENPNQQATLQVTSHKTIVFNEQSDKYVATEDDKTFIPAAMTFGKCTLKPSSSGNLPCSPQCAPKWSKTYEGTKVLDKNTLTEISELQCMIGGKITIAKHGQTDSVLLQHSENTTPLEVSAVNPTIEMPKKEPALPSVDSITLTKISGRSPFSTQKSDKKIPPIYLRKGEEVSFKASVKKGNSDLVSWMIYKGFKGEKKSELLEKQQIGVEFSHKFEEYGDFRIEGFGTPKNSEKYKSYDDCSINLRVIENTIASIKCLQEGETAENIKNNWVFKKGASLTFKANFYIEPTEEELSSLKMTVLDERGSILNDFSQKGNSITFVPENKGTVYTIQVEYTTSSGKKVQEKLKGKCALNSVISISPTNNASEIRPNEEIIINVTKMRFSDNSEDLANIKWALNGKVVQEGGRTYKFSNDKEGLYYIEAFSLKSNSLTKPDEKDTWKLTITENEVKDISAEGMPRVGKPLTLTAKTIFPDLSDKDLKNLKWDIPFSYIDENGIEHKPFEKHFQIKGMGLGSPKDPRTKIIIPSVEGEFEVTCSINKKTIKNKINIVRPTISSPHWIDKDGSSGNILATAGYDQEMYAYIKHLGLDGEEVVVEVYDAKDKKNPIFTSEKITVPVGSKEFTFHYSVKKVFKGKTEEEKKEEDRNRKDFQIFFKVKPIDNKLLKESLNEEFENNLLTITNKGDIVEAYFCNSDDTEKRKFIESGKVAHLKIYATNMKNREVEVLFFTRDKFHYPKNTTQNELTWQLWSEIKTHNIKGEPFHSTKGKINNKGELLVELDTSKYKWIKEDIIAVFKIKGKEGNEKGAYIKEWYSLILHSYPQLTKLAENKATVKVGGLLGIGKVERVELEEEGHSCPRCTAPVTVAQLRELFPKAEEDTLKTVAYTYTKYMKELQMDTCWNKAHFFAQAAIETGFKLDIKSGEGFDYYWEDLIKKFGAFQTTEGRKKAKEWGRAERNSKINGKTNPKYQSVSLENKKKIANWAYSPSSKTGKELGNIYDNDGWTFRGKGLIQLTGRSAYQYANTYTKKENADIIANPDLVMTDITIGVISSMAFFKWKKINFLANRNRNTKSVCKLVGEGNPEIYDPNGKKSDNHTEKKIFFENFSSKVFKIDECLWSKEWHDPVDDPMICLYTQHGNFRPRYNVFGTVRKERSNINHQGIDLLALPGSNVYACVDAYIEFISNQETDGYGKVICLRVKDPTSFLKRKRDFHLIYENEGEILAGKGFNFDGEIYLFYAHLSKIWVSLSDKEVNSGQLIAFSGTTGYTSTRDPHLHFEIRNLPSPKGLSNRCHPGIFVYYKDINTITEEEKEKQKKIAEKYWD